MSISKENLRKAMIAKRDSLHAQDRAAKSLTICRNLEVAANAQFGHRSSSMPVPNIAVYSAMRSEVNLQHFIAYCYRELWNVCFPVMVKTTSEEAETKARKSEMRFVRLSRHDADPLSVPFLSHPARSLTPEELQAGGWELVAPEKLDMVVVPMVAYDNDNHRLGYGGGNYDRFLPQLKSDALVVGAAFKDQCAAEVPVEEHDIALSDIVTD